MKREKSTRQRFLDKLLGQRRQRRERHAPSHRFRRFESLENRLMLHGDEIHDSGDHDGTAAEFTAMGEGTTSVNGPHNEDPDYDPFAPIPTGTEPIHLHTRLSIYVNGNLVPIPANIGKADFIHTHAADGVVHVHPFTPPNHFVTLGDFFDTWKTGTNPEPNAVFNKNNLMNSVTDATHTVEMFVNGFEVDSFENYQLHDGDDIVLAYTSNPILTLNTSIGRIPIELFADKAPQTVNNFLNYVNDGDYANSIFHRFVPGFVMQGGGFKSTTTSFADPSVVNNFTTVPSDAAVQNEFDNFVKLAGTGAAVTTGNTTVNLGTADLSGVVVGDRLRLNGRTDGSGGTNMFEITAINDAANTVTVQTAPSGASATNLAWSVFPKVNRVGTLSMAKLGGNPNSATNQFFINLANNDANLDLQNGGFTVFGQILDQSILTDIAALNDLSVFTASLNGAAEVPPVTSSATGTGTLALNNNNNQFDLTLNVQGLTAGAITASHIHTGAINVDGPNVFDLGAGSQYTVNGTSLQRKIDNGAFPTASLNSLFQTQTYLNIHTSANPDGEIRGQLNAVQSGLYSDLPTTSTDQLVVIQSISGEGLVKGKIFTDSDNDGVKDESEVGRQGFTVFSDTNNNGTLDSGETSAATDGSGNYILRVNSGQHKIRLVPTNGFAKTTPSDAFDVTVQIGREVLGRDFGVLQVPTPTGLDLHAATDSGFSSADNVTNFNNSTTARALQFVVPGVTDGALVRILADGVVIGQSTVPAGSSGTITITTNGATTLADGVRGIIATQELRGVQSSPTTPLSITIDSTVPGFTSTAPTTGAVGVAYNYNAENPEEGQANFVYALLSPPTGAVIIPSTGVVTWTPTATQTGTQNFQVSATDAAGNVNTQSISVAVNKIAQLKFNLQVTDINGNPITQINVGSTFQLRSTVEDIRTTGTRSGVFSAYEDVAFDGNLATASAITHSSVYGQGPSGTLSSGLIDEIGSFAPSITPLGPNPQLLYTVTLTANRSGTLTFTGDKPDTLPQHDIGLYGRNERVDPEEANYGSTTLTIINPGFVALPDVFNFDEDTTNNPLNVLVNDQGQQGSTLTIVSTTPTSQGGTVTIASDNKSLLYTPAANFFGEDTFTYIVSDGSDQAVASVAVQVVDKNDVPPAINDTFSGTDAVQEDSTGNTLDLLKNERAATNIDQGAPNEILRISAVGTTSSGGTVIIGSNGNFVTYAPAPNFSGTETFTYTITDRSGTNGLTSTATATVTVTPQNDSPVAVSDSVTATEDSQNNIFSVLTNDTNGEPGETLTITSVSAGSRGGQITIVENNTKVSYTPAANTFGTETFTYTISDGNSGSSNATVAVNITAVNDAPDAIDDTINVGKNSTNNILDLLTNDVSTPDAAETLVISTVTPGNHGGVIEIIESGARVRYTPANGYLGAETFSYTMRDPGGLTDTATVNVTVRDFLPSSLAGFVYVDADGDGVKDDGEQPVSAVTITLTGTDNFGAAVSLQRTTDSTGAYKFENLAPGSYKIKETQPTGEVNSLPIVDGIDTIGSQGGTVSANDEFTITLAENVNGTGNNFGEVTGFTIAGRAMELTGGAGDDQLAFSSVNFSLYRADAQNQSTGSAIKTASLRADGTFAFDGIAAGTYVLQNEALTFLDSGATQKVVTVNGADSLNNIVELGNLQPKYISYRSFMNSTPRTGIFASVTPGTNGHQWSALDSNWSGFSEAKVELSADGQQVRLDVTRTTGEKLFTEVPVTDQRIATIAQEGTARLLRLVGGSSAFNLQPIPTTASGEGESGAEGEAFSTFFAAPIVVQPGSLDSESSSSDSQDLVYVVDTSAADHLDSEGESSEDSSVPQAIDAIMAEENNDSLDSDGLVDDLAEHHHDEDSTSLLDALDATFEEVALV